MENNSVKTICFVSDEIWPGTGGGIGRLICENARLLAEDGLAPVLLLDVDDRARDAFLAYAEVHMPLVRVYTVDDLLSARNRELQKYGNADIGLQDFRFYYYWRAYLIDLCLQYIMAEERINGIEFADYLGQGYVYLKMRPHRENCRDVPAWVRLHGSAELWDDADGKDKFIPERLQLYDMERYCLARCDRWVAPSAGVQGWYRSYYGIEKQSLVLPPDFQHLGPACVHPRQPDHSRPRRVLFYGKLQRIKGPDLLVQAALEFLRCDDPGAEFLLVGPDVADADGESMRAHLERLIPRQYRANFIFKGEIEPSGLPEIAAGCDLAVIPSRVETFCLAAQELNWIGIPLLVSEIPGLADYFVDGENCFKFDGTAPDLYLRLKQFFGRPDIVKRLRWQVPEMDTSAADLYRALSGEPISAAGAPTDELVKEPRVAIFSCTSAAHGETGDTPESLNYDRWQVWLGCDEEEAGLFGGQPCDPQLLPDDCALERLPDGRRQPCWGRLDAEYCLFLPTGVRTRPGFVRPAVKILAAEPGLAGVACYAELDSPAPGGKKYVIPYDLNRYLVFTENVTGSLPVLWRREAVDGLCLEDLVEPAARWSFLCSLAAAGKQVVVLPRVLMELSELQEPRLSFNPGKQQPGYIKENALELVSLFSARLREIEGDKRHLYLRIEELEKLHGDLYAEVKRLGASWEELRTYTLSKEELCAQLWNDLVESRGTVEEMRRSIEKQQAEMNALLAYLEEKKLVKLMTAAGFLDIRQFGRVK